MQQSKCRLENSCGDRIEKYYFFVPLLPADITPNFAVAPFIHAGMSLVFALIINGIDQKLQKQLKKRKKKVLSRNSSFEHKNVTKNWGQQGGIANLFIQLKLREKKAMATL